MWHNLCIKGPKQDGLKTNLREDRADIWISDSTEMNLVGVPLKKATTRKFLNLANSLGDKMRADTPVEKDILCRMLFLNLRLDNKNTPSYLWKEPFATLIKSRKISFGAPD